jgi:hypothetical protein
MESYTNNKLKKKLQRKGIILDERKKQCFDKYSYYQVINAYKNIFCMGIETIDDIENNIMNSLNLDRYKENYGIKKYYGNKNLYRQVLISICTKYGISYKYIDSDDELKEKIKNIKYYNHLYSNKVMYSDFIRIYKFEHELRNILLRYTLIIEESLKNVLVSYLNRIEAKDTFLTDINQYDTTPKNITNSINSIKKIFDKQTNKYSNPIKRKNAQELSVPYWIIINELTLGETIKLIINLNKEHKQKVLEDCVNYFTQIKIDSKDIETAEENNIYWNKLNVMREILNIIGILRNSLAHNQPIYNFNVKEFYSTKSGKVNYLLPKASTQHEQYVLTTNYMSYLADFFGSDKYNSFSGNSNIDLSWVIYIIYKIINRLDNNTNIYNELVYVYKKYNIILRPEKIATNKFDLYEKMLNKLEEYSNYDFDIKSICEKYDNDKRIKQDLISLNKKTKDMQLEMKKMINENLKNNDCLKYTHFLFDKSYTKYTGIDKKFFDKLKNDK